MEAKENQSVASHVATVVNIPGYEIKDVLGRGGMATVYLAEQQSIGRQVALKVLSPDHSDPTFSDRFLREARIISKLSHPNIITIYDAGIYQGCHYMAMEYIRGKNMRDARDDLSRREKLNIIKQMAQALEFAGSKGYVHRDIKPENIMLHDDGRAILTDFGIARGQETNHGLTQTGKTIGTPYYMSPEQTKGVTVDHRSDIYSLGVVLFQALAGYVPYDGPSLVAIGIKHLSEPIPPLPAGLELFQPILNICMSKDPAHRYQTAGDFLAALNKITDAEIDYVEAKAKVTAGHRPPQTNTSLEDSIVSHISQPQVLPRVRKRAEPPPINITDTDEFKSLKRRRSLLLLILLVLLGAAGYYKRDVLIPIWESKILPVVQPYLPDTIKQKLAVTEARQATPETTQTVDTQAKEIKQQSGPSDTARADATFENEDIQVDKIPVQQYTSDGRINADNALQLAASYKKRLQANPQDVNAKTGMQDLQSWFRDEIRTAINEKDAERARQRLSLLQEAFPRIATQPRFVQLTEQLVEIEKFDQHIKMANVYFATNALTKPEGANALEELLAASLIDPESQQIKQGLNRIAELYYDKAKASASPAEAIEFISAGLQADKDHAGLNELKTLYTSKLKEEKKISELVNLMNEKIKQRQYIRPAGDSLYDLSRQILEKDPANKDAIRGQRIVEEQFVFEAQAELKKEDPLAAKKILNEARNYFPNSLALARITKQVDAKIDATYPKITKVVFSDKPITSLAQQPVLEKMQPGQTLYLGFGYKNFYTSTTTLDIRLIDPSGQELYTEIPTTVTGKSGTHYLSVTLPNSGSRTGDYALEILMENTRIQRAILKGLH